MRILLLLLSLVFVNSSAFAKKIKGYIIEEGDTTEVILYVKGFLGEPSITKNYNQFKYSKNGGAKELLFPKEGTSVVFEHISKKYVFMSLPKIDDQEYAELYFTNVDYIGGNMLVVSAVRRRNHGEYYNTTTGMFTGGGTTTTTLKTLYSEEKGYLVYNLLNFRKKAKIYFSDCSSLVEKIDNRSLTSKELVEIVKIYDQCKSL